MISPHEILVNLDENPQISGPPTSCTSTERSTVKSAAPFPGFPGWKNLGALERSKYRNSNIVMDIVNIGYLEYVIYLLCVYWFDI